MRHSHLARISARALLSVVSLAILGACADTPSAPAAAIKAKAPKGYDIVLGTTTFVWTPSEGVTQRMGDHEIVIPAGAICDPETSSYGFGHWEEPCDPATTPITITATSFSDAGGHPYVDFEPSLRFVPTSEVYLFLRDGERDGRNMIAMSYCMTTTYCVDESLADSSLATQRVGRTRTLFRRLKHFSGYILASSGDECLGVIEQLEDGSLFCNTDGGGHERSGYVVASGLGKKTGDAFGKRRRYDK